MSDLTKKFESIGAAVKVSKGPLRVNITEDDDGKTVFDLQSNDPLVVLDVDEDEKHLVLMSRANDGRKPKFLCGFDEQGYFAAPLPESRNIKWFRGTKPGKYRGISTVESAKAALKPAIVVEEEEKS